MPSSYIFSYPILGISVFFIGFIGVCVLRRNIIIVLMSIELMLFGTNILFIYFSVFFDDLLGQLFALFILTVAAAESAIGLAILVIYYRLRGSISTDTVDQLKG